MFSRRYKCAEVWPHLLSEALPAAQDPVTRSDFTGGLLLPVLLPPPLCHTNQTRTRSLVTAAVLLGGWRLVHLGHPPGNLITLSVGSDASGVPVAFPPAARTGDRGFQGPGHPDSGPSSKSKIVSICPGSPGWGSPPPLLMERIAEALWGPGQLYRGAGSRAGEGSH